MLGKFVNEEVFADYFHQIKLEVQCFWTFQTLSKNFKKESFTKDNIIDIHILTATLSGFIRSDSSLFEKSKTMMSW